MGLVCARRRLSRRIGCSYQLVGRRTTAREEGEPAASARPPHCRMLDHGGGSWEHRDLASPRAPAASGPLGSSMIVGSGRFTHRQTGGSVGCFTRTRLRLPPVQADNLSTEWRGRWAAARSPSKEPDGCGSRSLTRRLLPFLKRPTVGLQPRRRGNYEPGGPPPDEAGARYFSYQSGRADEERVVPLARDGISP